MNKLNVLDYHETMEGGGPSKPPENKLEKACYLNDMKSLTDKIREDEQVDPVTADKPYPRHESAEMPIPCSTVREAKGSEERVKEILDEDIVENIRGQLVKLYETGVIDSEAEMKHMTLLLSNFGQLYRGGTLEDHQQLVDRLIEEHYLADKIYDRIHRDKALQFSRFERKRPNDFVRELVGHGWIHPGSLILELGPGGGQDARHIAEHVPGSRVMGVDISEHACDEAKRITESRRMERRVRFRHGNYFDALNNVRGQLIDGVYMHSSPQYRPRKILEDVLFEQIFTILHPTRGKLYLAMKIGASDSANSDQQIALLRRNRDNPKIDLRQNGCFRLYPEREEDIHSLITPSGLKILDSQVVPCFGYDRPGETEYFCQVVARAE